MSISEQVKELRETANKCKIGAYVCITNLLGVMNEAADTIESLSEKLADMERPAEDCGGGWIPCKDRLPEIEQTVLLSLRSLDVCVGFRANTEGYFYAEGEGYILYENVLAWMPQPEPYHEP